MAKVVEKAQQEKEALISGSEAIAVACKLADVDVITAYPIRPYDTVMQYVAKLVANGELDCEYIVAESEHSQFEIVKHASAAGARVFCGSSGVGWMYAFEALTVTPALRIPMVAMVGNRALDDPGAFGVEHNDALAVRDLGWQLVWVDNAQEALDTALIAYRVAEDRRVFLPCAIACDGAFLTHSQALTKIPPQEWVDAFLPPYNRGDLLLHPDNPITVAPQVNEDWLMELRKHNDEAMKRSKNAVIPEAYRDFERIFNRSYGNPFFEEYQTEGCRHRPGGHGDAVDAGEGRHPADAQGGQEGRVCTGALVPAVPGRGSGRDVGALQGGRRHRPRLLLRLAALQRCAGHRSARRAVPGGQAPAGGGFHLRSGRPRSDRARRAAHERDGVQVGGRRDPAAHYVDRNSRINLLLS